MTTYAIPPLRNAIAHCRYAACDLDLPHSRNAGPDECNLRIMLIRLMRREHVIVEVIMAILLRTTSFQRGFVLWLTGRLAMRRVAAGQLRSVDRGVFAFFNAGKIKLRPASVRQYAVLRVTN